MVSKLIESKDWHCWVVQMERGMVICKDHYAFHPDPEHPQRWRRVDYVFYLGCVPLHLQAWATFKVAFTRPLPLVATARYLAAPVLRLQDKDAAWTQNNVVNVSGAVTQMQVV